MLVPRRAREVFLPEEVSRRRLRGAGYVASHLREAERRALRIGDDRNSRERQIARLNEHLAATRLKEGHGRIDARNRHEAKPLRAGVGYAADVNDARHRRGTCSRDDVRTITALRILEAPAQ